MHQKMDRTAETCFTALLFSCREEENYRSISIQHRTDFSRLTTRLAAGRRRGERSKMFFHIVLERNMQLHPRHFGPHLRDKLVSKLIKDVEGTCR
jgi:hypothetical protein